MLSKFLSKWGIVPHWFLPSPENVVLAGQANFKGREQTSQTSVPYAAM